MGNARVPSAAPQFWPRSWRAGAGIRREERRLRRAPPGARRRCASSRPRRPAERPQPRLCRRHRGLRRRRRARRPRRRLRRRLRRGLARRRRRGRPGLRPPPARLDSRAGPRPLATPRSTTLGSIRSRNRSPLRGLPGWTSSRRSLSPASRGRARGRSLRCPPRRGPFRRAPSMRLAGRLARGREAPPRPRDGSGQIRARGRSARPRISIAFSRM